MILSDFFFNYIAVHSEAVEAAISCHQPFDCDLPGWLAWHVVEHQARHRGQIFMLLRMQGIEVPDV